MKKNTTNTINEMVAAGYVGWFTKKDYENFANENWVKISTLVNNNAVERKAEKVVCAKYTPNQMADYVNNLFGQDLYDCEEEYRWNEKELVFELIETEWYYRVKNDNRHNDVIEITQEQFYELFYEICDFEGVREYMENNNMVLENNF